MVVSTPEYIATSSRKTRMQKGRGHPRIELGTSMTLTLHHTTRPVALDEMNMPKVRYMIPCASKVYGKRSPGQHETKVLSRVSRHAYPWRSSRSEPTARPRLTPGYHRNAKKLHKQPVATVRRGRKKRMTSNHCWLAQKHTPFVAQALNYGDGLLPILGARVLPRPFVVKPPRVTDIHTPRRG